MGPKIFLSNYSNDFDEDLLKAQLKTFSNSFQSQENLSFEDIISHFKESGQGIRSLLSEVGRILKLLQVVPASNASLLVASSTSKFNILKVSSFLFGCR